MKIIRNSEQIDFYINAVRSSILQGGRGYYIYTFGCQQNEADSEKLRGMCEQMGFVPAATAEDAYLILVNTCAIREHAEMKALSLLGSFKAIKKKRPELIVGIVGCMAAEQHIAEKLKTDFHYISFTVEPNLIARVPELVYLSTESGKRSFVFGQDKGDVYEGLPVSRVSSHRAWVSVMYGCNNFCSYCIVPYVRGRERSRDSVDIIAECRELINSGVKEITLLGQNVNSYKSDISFAQLITKIAEIEGDFIIRFMTSHPKDTSDELIAAMRQRSDKIAPFFHLPLQSGSNAVLKTMNRTYTRESFLDIVDKLRAEISDIALSTDVIVGFPGETEEDFEQTLDIIKRVRFDNVYAFIYSPRVGTVAAKLEDAVPGTVKSERLRRLLEIQDVIALEKNIPYKDKPFRVLVDSVEERGGRVVYSGRTYTNKLVHFTGDNIRVGDFEIIKIEKTGAFDLIGSK